MAEEVVSFEPRYEILPPRLRKSMLTEASPSYARRSDRGPVAQDLGKTSLGEGARLRLTSEALCSLSAFVNRGPDDCAANSSNAAALCSAADGIHDNSGAVLPGNAGRRGLRGRPSYGNRGGPDRRLEPGRCALELWLRSQLRPVQQWQQPRIVN